MFFGILTFFMIYTQKMTYFGIDNTDKNHRDRDFSDPDSHVMSSQGM